MQVFVDITYNGAQNTEKQEKKYNNRMYHGCISRECLRPLFYWSQT